MFYSNVSIDFKKFLVYISFPVWRIDENILLLFLDQRFNL